MFGKKKTEHEKFMIAEGVDLTVSPDDERVTITVNGSYKVLRVFELRAMQAACDEILYEIDKNRMST